MEHYPPPRNIKERIFKIVGIGETIVYEKLKDLVAILQNSGIMLLLPGPGEVWLIFKWDGLSNKQDDLFQQSENEIINILGDDLTGLMMKHCQGRLGTPCKPGAYSGCWSHVQVVWLPVIYRCIREFPLCAGRIVAYSNEIKEKVLSNRKPKQYGAISPETAREMARGARMVFDSTFGLATTGLAPKGVRYSGGTVYLGLSTPDAELAQKVFILVLGGSL